MIPALAGQAVWVLGQMAVLIALARGFDLESLGAVALVAALAQPLMLACGLGLRVGLTVAGPGADLAAYLTLRLVGMAVFAAVLGAGAALARPDLLALAAALGAGRLAEMGSDLALGATQRLGRTGEVGRSLALRGAGGALAAGLALMAGAPVWAVLAAQSAAWALVLGLHDAPLWRASGGGARPGGDPAALTALARRTAPLAGAALGASLQASLARLVIAGALGPAALGLWALVAPWPQAATMLFNAGVQSRTPALAAHLRAGAPLAARREIGRLLGLALALAAAGGAAALLLAAPLVHGLFALSGAEAATAHALLLWAALAAAAMLPGAVLHAALQAAGRFAPGALVQGAALLALGPVLLAGLRLGGLTGAGAALAALALARLGVQAWLARRLLRPAGPGALRGLRA